MVFAKSFASLAFLTSLCVPYASAGIVSLYVPENVAGVGVPISADPIGTDNTGHTTWRIGVGAPSGTFTKVDSVATSIVATMVEGASDVQVFANVGGATSAHESCAFATATASGAVPIASCVLEIADGSTTGSIAGTETATPIAVQIADKTGGKGNGAGRTSFMGFGALGVLGVANVMLSVAL